MNCNNKGVNLSQIRGDTINYKFQRENCEGEIITTRPDELFFTVKEATTQEEFVFQKRLDDMTLDTDGTYHFTVEPEDTNNLIYGDYVYDIEVINDGVKSTIGYGGYKILPEVTWVENEGE